MSNFGESKKAADVKTGRSRLASSTPRAIIRNGLEYRLIRRSNVMRGRGKHGRYLWEVVCPYCGKIFLALPHQLGGGAKGCGCRHGKPRPDLAKDQTQHPTYKVLRRTENKYGKSYLWEVECPCCGGIFTAMPCTLGKNVFNCGCQKRNNYTGKIVNYLFVVKKVGMRRYGNGSRVSVYECLCTYQGCGNSVLATSGELGAGKKSCGCKMRDDMRRRHLDKYKNF